MTNETTIVLNTPEQITAWIWLSRKHQCRLHMEGYTVPHLFTWLKRNVPDITTERTVKDAYPRLLDYLDTIGIDTSDDTLCNYQILMTPSGGFSGLYFDRGIVGSLSEVEANPDFVNAYADGRLVIMRTMAETREPDKTIRMMMNP